MRSFLLAVLCVALLATGALAHGDHGDHSHDDGDVVILDNSNFDSEVKGADLTLVEFFAPWCGHCKALAPNFARAATELKGVAKLASVDCTVHKDLCSRYGVQGFPTLKVFRAAGDINKPADYQGGRSDKDIIKYIRKQTEPAFQQISTAAELETLRQRDGVEIVGVFSDLESTEAQAFKAAAESLRNDYTFAITSNTELGAANSLNLYKGDDATPVTTTEADVLASPAAWVQAEAFELVGEIGPENFQKYLDRGLPLVWAFVDYSAANADKTKDLLKEIETAAKSVKGKLSVVKLDGTRWAEHAKHFGLTSTLPGIVVEDRENSKNYIFPQDQTVTADSLSAHLNGFLSGSLKANLKSQAEPANNNGPVTVLVGTNFEKVVIEDAEKDAFVEFYAPWCGHCKSLAPKWDLLGEEFRTDSNIVIAKVDATENDTPAKIEGFPTLIFYPAGDKSNPVTYDGDRSVEAMVAFIKENRKSSPVEEGSAAANTVHEEL